MSSDFLKINSYVMDDVSNVISRSKNNFSNVGDSCKTDFRVMKNGKLFNTGINKINSQFDDLISRLNYMNTSVSRNTNEFFELERKLNEEALAIEIPNDFETNSSITEQNIKNISLSKNDGRSVNDGRALFDNTEQFDSSIASEKKLANISNSNTSSVEDINEYTGSSTTLNNINNNRELNEEKLEEYKETENITVNNINNNNQTNTVNISDASIIDKKELDELEKNGGDN